jgi:Glycosyl transferase family 2
MAVHNGEEFVAGALESILGQTLADIEVVVIDDGSDDQSAGEVRRVADDRVVLVRLEEPSGDLALALNEGVKRCRADLIARMDADDISLPSRLEQQAGVMTSDPRIAMLGSWAEALDGSGEQWMISRPPCDDASIRFILNYRCPFHHPSMMLRKEHLEAAGGYRAGYRYAEDYDLWRRMMKQGKGLNLPEVLIAQRYYSSSTSGRNRLMQQARSDDIGAEMLGEALGRPVSGMVVSMLREQVGPADRRSAAGAVLLDLYRECLGSKDFPDRDALKRVAATEMIDLALKGALPFSLRLWADAFRIDRSLASRRATEEVKESLRQLRKRLR